VDLNAHGQRCDLPQVLLAYCLLTQVVKVVYIRRFKSWL
jgi:hypothetical protein